MVEAFDCLIQHARQIRNSLRADWLARQTCDRAENRRIMAARRGVASGATGQPLGRFVPGLEPRKNGPANRWLTRIAPLP